MMEGQFDTLKLKRRGAVLWVAMGEGPALDRDLARLFWTASRTSDLRAVVLTGAQERAFCVGGGGASVPTEEAARNAFWLQGMRDSRDLVVSMLDCDKPVIARINGHAVGKGCSIALCCDITVMVEDAKIGDTHVKVGLTAGDGGSLLWPHLVGMACAKRYLLTGDLLTGREAERVGLISEAVPRGELDARIEHWVERMSGAAAIAVATTKRALNAAIRQQAASHLDMSLGLETQTFLTEDHREGVAALVEKRSPKFSRG